jgi:hypothetical protein
MWGKVRDEEVEHDTLSQFLPLHESLFNIGHLRMKPLRWNDGGLNFGAAKILTREFCEISQMVENFQRICLPKLRHVRRRKSDFREIRMSKMDTYQDSEPLIINHEQDEKVEQ